MARALHHARAMKRGAISALFAFALAAACGGSTEGSGSGGSAGSSGASGSAGSSGNGATSGTSGSGGNPAGGAGGSAASGGSGGGGAGGSAAATSFDDCTDAGQCVLFAKNCCGSYCNDVPISAYLPINGSFIQQVTAAQCVEPVGCPDCISMEQPNYFAACRANECVAVDLRTDALSACNSSAECRLRWGASCCESCSQDTNQIVALNQNASLEQEVCDPLAGACPPCVPQPFPADVAAECISGQCQVVFEAQPGG